MKTKYVDILTGREIVELAQTVATESHEGQKRKFSGEDYIVHPRAVGAILSLKYKDDPNQLTYVALGLMHDVLEDTLHTECTLHELGFPEYFTAMLKVLTHPKEESYFDYIMRVGESHMARKVKIADLEHNMSDLKEGSMLDKYRFAHKYLTERERYWENKKGKADK